MSLSCIFLFALFSTSLCYARSLNVPVLGVFAADSGCGTFNCTDFSYCPNFNDNNYAQCYNGACGYTPSYNNNICTSVQLCGSTTCDCANASKTVGCECSSDDECNDACINGTCQASGYPGELCGDGCNFGVCKNNHCQFVPNGDPCQQDTDCEIYSMCEPNKQICVPLLPCAQTPFSTGFCTNPLDFCSQSMCIPMLNKTDGPCQLQQECQVGYNCISGTCQRVPLGTPCNSTEDCELFTQGCFCAVPDNSVPTQCLDSGLYNCRDELQAYEICSYKYCEYSDFDNITSPCYLGCYDIFVDLFCCSNCEYPEINDNAIPNFTGVCADKTLQPVDCCNYGTPCVITTLEDMCAGYSTKKTE